MKRVALVVNAFCTTCLFGRTFHPPTMSDLIDQNCQVNEERIALLEFERNSGAIGSVTQCQQRARSWRVPNEGASSVDKTESFDAKGQLQE